MVHFVKLIERPALYINQRQVAARQAGMSEKMKVRPITDTCQQSIVYIFCLQCLEQDKSQGYQRFFIEDV